MRKGEITAAVAARLVAEQFPQWAALPVARVALDGWDNTTFRLGDELSIRLPSDDAYVAQIEKEHRWLPVLAGHLAVPIPEPVALGEPSEAFPRPWSIYRWIEGDAASMAPITDLDAFAGSVAEFLRELHAIDATGGPHPGRHNFWRGGSPANYDALTRESIEQLAATIDAALATKVWDAALASSWDAAPVWVHGDVAASNLLVADGALCAVIDFGCAAVGDPACDLVIAWTFFSDGSRETFRRGVPLDEATWARARGWALWKAVITLARDQRGEEHADASARRWGWRTGPAQVVEALLSEVG